MASTRQKTLMVLLLIAGLLGDGGSLFAGQKMQAMMNNGAEMGRELSTNEVLLEQFQTERAQLLSRKSKDTPPHLLKNKIKILDGKISFLESQLKHGKPASAPKKPAVKAVVTAPKPVTSQTVQRKAPISLRLKPYARPEPRHRIFVAMTKKSIELRPAQRSTERLEAATQSVPEKVRLQPAATKAPVAPLVVDPVPSAKPAERGLPMARAAIPGQKTAKTGRDWERMTPAEKDIYVLSVMGNLSRRDVFLEKGHSFYIREIDKKLKNNPSLENEYVHKILIAIAYENEPESRQDIDSIGK